MSSKGLTKEAILGAIASGIAQNIIGMPIVKSKAFKSSLLRSAAMGAAGKKSPRTLKSLSKDALSGVVSPEVNAAKNTAYSAAYKNHGAKSVPKHSARDLVVARLALAGDKVGLKRIGKSDSPLAKKVTSFKEGSGLHNVSKKDTTKMYKDIAKLPNGKRVPSSSKAAIAANIAIAPLPGGLSTAAVNMGKLGLASETAGKSKLLQKINKKMVSDPIKAKAKQGASGSTFNQKIHNAKSILLNPFTSEAERLAHKAGSKVKQPK